MGCANDHPVEFLDVAHFRRIGMQLDKWVRHFFAQAVETPELTVTELNPFGRCQSQRKTSSAIPDVVPRWQLALHIGQRRLADVAKRLRIDFNAASWRGKAATQVFSVFYRKRQCDAFRLGSQRSPELRVTVPAYI